MSLSRVGNNPHQKTTCVHSPLTLRALSSGGRRPQADLRTAPRPRHPFPTFYKTDFQMLVGVTRKCRPPEKPIRLLARPQSSRNRRPERGARRGSLAHTRRRPRGPACVLVARIKQSGQSRKDKSRSKHTLAAFTQTGRVLPTRGARRRSRRGRRSRAASGRRGRLAGS